MAGLYHYTTGTGLLGMLKDYSDENPNLTMWATHYMYMNDPTEYLYGEKICFDIIDDIEDELNIEKKNRTKELATTEFSKLAQRKLRRFLHIDDLNKIRTCPYLISLSKAKDSLHMWSMYAKNGNGIAITFNKKELCSHYKQLENCIYPKTKKDYYHIKQKIKELYYDFNENPIYASSPMEEPIEKANAIANTISLLVGIFIKHCSYKDEKEVRFVASQAKEILFRDKNGLIIPYVEQKIPFECVENIIVGPTADFNRVRESILLLMNSRGIMWDEDRIIKSNVPYRE